MNIFKRIFAIFLFVIMPGASYVCSAKRIPESIIRVSILESAERIHVKSFERYFTYDKREEIQRYRGCRKQFRYLDSDK